MNILFNETTKTFHLFNEDISYLMTVLRNGQIGHLYFGKKIHHKEDFSYLLETAYRPMTSYVFEDDRQFSLEHIKQEYGLYGTTDFRHPAVEIQQANGSTVSDFQYKDYEIMEGKPKLAGLPATYTESSKEALTLIIRLEDPLTHVILELSYTIFARGGIIARDRKSVV